MSKDNEYFARLDDEELIDALTKRQNDYYDHLETTGIFNLMKRSYVAFYGGDLNSDTSIFDSSRLGRSGKAGQITEVKINNYRNLVKHAITLATANRTSLTCVATNTDQKTMAQVVLADSLLDYYIEQNKVGTHIRSAVEYGCLMGEGWLHAPWEPKKGEVYEVGEDNRPVYEGDLDITYHSPLDVVRDINLTNTEFPWLMLKKMVNKHELAARYPEIDEDDILDLSNHSADYSSSDSFLFSVTTGASDNSEDSDIVPLWTFYHDKTEAMPEGRVTIFSGDIIFYDSDLPYDRIPLIDVMPDVLHQSPFGYSPFNDLLGPQQAHDNLISTALSNNLSFGMQFLWTKKNEDLDVSSLEDGLKLIKSNTKPEPLQLTRTAPELYSFLNMIDSYQEQMAGISSTIRGKPESNIQSGTAMALMVAQSVQFGSQLEESYNNMLIKTGETIISHLQSFAKTPRLAFIVGIAKQPYMEEFTGEDISDIKRIAVQQVNALSKTISGRVDLAEKVMQLPPDKVAQYMSIINTGQLPPELQLAAPVMNIKAENERLAKGQQVQAVMTEHHANHIKQHSLLIENPTSKEDENLVRTTLEHIAEHIRLWRETDPAILMVTGQTPPPPANAPQGAPQGAGGPPLPPQGPTKQAGPEDIEALPGVPDLPPGTDVQSQIAYEGNQGGNV